MGIEMESAPVKYSALMICLLLVLQPLAVRAEEKPPREEILTLIVMDPLAAPLSCPCVEGYAQRDYEKLAKYLEEQVGMEVKLVFDDSLTEALQDKTSGKASLIVGKDSVVRHDALKAKLSVSPIARLTAKDGKTTQTGLIIVRAEDPAQSLSDLENYRFLLGPAASEEKHSAARNLLSEAGVTLPEKVETSDACSDGACKIVEWGDQVQAATVISSYAKPLLEGCGTISKGDLRVIAETKPVPFITAFVNSQLPVAIQKDLQAALLGVAKDRSLCQALESLIGFVPLPSEEAAVVKKNKALRSGI